MKASRSTRISSARWLAYATAGLATAAGSAATVEAEIHYSGIIDQTFDGTSEHLRASFPLSGGVSLTFSQFASGAHLYDVAYFGVKGAAVSNAFRGISPYFAARLHPRQDVADGRFFDLTGRRFPAILVGIYSDGAFARPGPGFVAFRFNNGNGLQYGWARLKAGGAPRNRFIVEDYAWADPGETIVAGQKRATSNNDAARPDEAALGLLALGGAGVMAWRRRS
jgi:MYXO-CTERM domain-containing protein